ncbi:methyltransferase [Klebsiella michiganensis]|uniref:methyltransferase n=1 Tax=Klebsiella michiganensis TaxID=1134687 RepID=UPI0016272DC5|nr:methyltransferase [Klebsiella michiganensis]QNE50871.1 methyltransferase [Klebsiella michiganensis]
MSFKLFPRQRTEPASIPLFSSGALTLSARVQWLDSTGLVDPHRFLHRHLRGDWGDLDDTERRANDAALRSEGVLTSRYQVTPRLFLLVTTNANHSQTVIRLPEENGPL